MNLKLNIVNNIKTCYYNYMVVFYLCLNYILPFYDDVIISMQSHSTKLLIGEYDMRMKNVKRTRMIEFIKNLEDDDKLYLDKTTNQLIVEYCNIYLDDDEDSNTLPTDTCEEHCDQKIEDEETQGMRNDNEQESSEVTEVTEVTEVSEVSELHEATDRDKIINDEIRKIFDIVNLNNDVKNKDD
jgi:hypothetical protein